jgi:hypothetical protein
MLNKTVMSGPSEQDCISFPVESIRQQQLCCRSRIVDLDQSQPRPRVDTAIMVEYATAIFSTVFRLAAYIFLRLVGFVFLVLFVF